jgi:endonuclease III-like uncharacterized protein
MIITALIRKTSFYNQKLSNLNFIKSELTNKCIGVGAVKWIVKHTFFKFFNQTIKFHRNMKTSDIKNIRNEMTKAEIDHLFAFIFVSISIVVQFYNQKYALVLTLLIVNIVMNLYPALLQQQNKRRIDKLISRFENV